MGTTKQFAVANRIATICKRHLHTTENTGIVSKRKLLTLLIVEHTPYHWHIAVHVSVAVAHSRVYNLMSRAREGNAITSVKEYRAVSGMTATTSTEVTISQIQRKPVSPTLTVQRTRQ